MVIAGLSATMQTLSEGRFVLGFGRGVPSQFAKLGIPIPLRVHGPFTNVSYGLDEKALGDELRKKLPDMIKDQILNKPGDIIKKPNSILDQFRR